MKEQGTLNREYSDRRKTRPELKFRLWSRAQVVEAAAKKYLRRTENLHILDMGSAEGKTILALNEMLPDCHFTGVEYSGELIREAPLLPSNIRLIKGDITRLPAGLHNEEFDVVSALAVLEHLRTPSDALSEAYRVLQTGGILVATCPEPAWDAVSSRAGLLDGDHHTIKMNKRHMKEIVANAGFKILEYRRFMWAPTSCLPYMSIPLSFRAAARIDRVVVRCLIFNWLFVNQLVVGIKL